MRAGRLPGEGAEVVVVLQVSQEEIRFRAQVRQITENDQPASFGIEFRETTQEIESKLIRLMDILQVMRKKSPKVNPLFSLRKPLSLILRL